ncbi:aminotransferase class I/II-fold pyridoxal phosphate-dependent enzyme [Rhizobium lusitanum]|uniref:Aminotransferase n=1 Tax=Rhizobium lusitanum TaxID=293958 RepID=A0A6L9UDI7_9HYPH|nr:aminotransferase class I/II-fold pyridoxal phosphate-dependent enzyme [Rhizobium lusitanum]NEI74013.1 aminotransferase class I/II-fold pyridoxal phosphate-dependent enzyme [Rhizobium lusitanum]
MQPLRQPQVEENLRRFSEHTRAIASDGSAGWAIADAAADALDRGEDVVSLCLGDTSFDTPTRISEAAIRSIREGRTHYAPVPGTPALRHSIAAAQRRFDGYGWSPEQAIVFGGAQNALFAALMTVAGAGDEVICLAPWYATYEASIRVGGAIARPVMLALDNGRQKISEEILGAAINGRTRAILLNSPNNPGGYVFSRQDLEVVAAFADRHNLWVISDEVYRSTVFDGEFLSVSSLPGMMERTIIVNSLSKSHAMTGWRLGWTLSPKSAAVHLENLAQCMLFGSPTFIQDAAALALETAGDAEMHFFADELKRRRDLMLTALSGIPQLVFTRPEGGMFCFIDVSATGLSGAAFAEQLYAQEKLAIVAGVAFGAEMKNFVRISFSGSDETIRKGMERLSRFCSGI